MRVLQKEFDVKPIQDGSLYDKNASITFQHCTINGNINNYYCHNDSKDSPM